MDASASPGAGGPVFDETAEMELAAELLDATGEAELDRFLGSLIRRAGDMLARSVPPEAAKALGSALKQVARQALPSVGGTLGSQLGGRSGAAIGRRIGSAAGRLFGLELEGLSPEDQEFEVARRFVRLAGQAVADALRKPTDQPRQAAHAALRSAARRYAPGILSPATPALAGSKRSGRWLRSGSDIVVIDV